MQVEAAARKVEELTREVWKAVLREGGHTTDLARMEAAEAKRKRKAERRKAQCS